MGEGKESAANQQTKGRTHCLLIDVTHPLIPSPTPLPHTSTTHPHHPPTPPPPLNSTTTTALAAYEGDAAGQAWADEAGFTAAAGEVGRAAARKARRELEALAATVVAFLDASPSWPLDPAGSLGPGRGTGR